MIIKYIYIIEAGRMLKELTKNNDMVAMLNDMKDFYFLACLDLNVLLSSVLHEFSSNIFEFICDPLRGLAS